MCSLPEEVIHSPRSSNGSRTIRLQPHESNVPLVLTLLQVLLFIGT